jgi:hypothetical protein
MSVKVAIVAAAVRVVTRRRNLAVGDRTVVAARRNEQALRDLPGNVRAEAAATHPAASFTRTGSG